MYKTEQLLFCFVLASNEQVIRSSGSLTNDIRALIIMNYIGNVVNWTEIQCTCMIPHKIHYFKGKP